MHAKPRHSSAKLRAAMEQLDARALALHRAGKTASAERHWLAADRLDLRLRPSLAKPSRRKA